MPIKCTQHNMKLKMVSSKLSAEFMLPIPVSVLLQL